MLETQPCEPHQAPVLQAHSDCKNEWQLDALNDAFRRHQHLAIEARHLLIQFRNERAETADTGRRYLDTREQLLEVGFAAVEAMVNSRVDEAPEETAAGDGQCREQRNAAVQRAQLEIAVIQRRDRRRHAEDHVIAKPPGQRADELERAEAFA